MAGGGSNGAGSGEGMEWLVVVLGVLIGRSRQGEGKEEGNQRCQQLRSCIRGFVGVRDGARQAR